MSHYFVSDDSVKRNKRNIYYSFNNISFKFVSDNGVFSKSEVDEGSDILLKSYLNGGKVGRVLDVGAGIGVLGIVISRVNDCEVDMLEINERAVELCKENIKVNKVNCNIYLSDMYEKANGKYDVIVSNPPIRAGKQVVFSILEDSYKYLNSGGELWVVIRKKQGSSSAKKKIEEVFGNCSIVKRDKGFYILKAVK